MVYFTASILMMLMLVDQILAVSDCNIDFGDTVGRCSSQQITSLGRITGDVTNAEIL